MFPAALATGPFSLRPGQPCAALSLAAELGPAGELLSHAVCASTVRPQARMTYEAVDAAAASAEPGALSPELRALLEVCACACMPHSAVQSLLLVFSSIKSTPR
jgi:exoribonuclease-2